MANSVSRLKNTDSSAQWADKINKLMDSVDTFITTEGSFVSSNSNAADLIVYDAGWKNKRLIAGDVTIDPSHADGISTEFQMKLDPLAISSKNDLTIVDSSADYLLIWDASDSENRLKKVKPQYLSSQVGGSNTQVQFNDGGSSLGGDAGLTYNKTTDILTIAGGLVVDTTTLVVDGTNNRVGVINSSPGYPLDVTGDINSTGTYRIGGSVLFTNATSLASSVVSSSLTSVGTLSTLTVSGAATFQSTVSALSLTVTNTITGSISGNAGTVTNGVYTTGDQTIGGTKTFSSTIAGNITGTSYNITQYTINQNLGTANSPSFAGLTVSATITGNISGNAGTVTNGVYTTGSYANPTWITSLASSKVTGLGTTDSVRFGSLGVGTAASGTTGEIRATNNITAYYSDRRLKENIQVIDSALNKISNISGVTFTQNKLAETYGYNDYSKQVGVIAQEILEVLPEAVTAAPFDISEDGTSKSGENYLTVRYERIVPLLIEGIKELRKEVEGLKNASAK